MNDVIPSYELDRERLPPGFQRVAYDMDRRVYRYRDSYGGEWEGEPGRSYGVLHRVGVAPMSPPSYPMAPPEPYHRGDEPSGSPIEAPASYSSWDDEAPRELAESPRYSNIASPTPLKPIYTSFTPPPTTQPNYPRPVPTAQEREPERPAPMTHFPDTWDPPADYELEDLPSAMRIKAKLGNIRRNVFARKNRGDSISSNISATMSETASSFASPQSPRSLFSRASSSFSRSDRVSVRGREWT